MVSMKEMQIQMNRKFKFVLLIILLCTGIIRADRELLNLSQKEMKWSTSYHESLELAKLKKMPVLIKFEASWCVWCEKMEEEVFTDQEVKKELEKFVCVKVDVDKQVDIAKAYKIKSLPRTIVINVYDEIVGDWLGYREAPAFAKLLRDIDEYTHARTGTTSMPDIQEETDTSAEAVNIPEINQENTNELIGLLGHTNSGVNRKVVELLVKTGPKVLPDVVPALEGKYLGTRIAAWKVVNEITGKKYKYDPWSSKIDRLLAAEKIRKELQKTGS